MANQRDELTKATGIIADVVMEVGAYFSAKEMRSVQIGQGRTCAHVSESRRKRFLTALWPEYGLAGAHSE